MFTTVYSQPRRWTTRAIGTPGRYRMFQVVCFTNALGILSMFFAASKGVPKTSDWWIPFGSMCIFIVVGVIQLPLMLLHALRAHMRDLPAERGFEVVIPADNQSDAK